MGDGWEWARVCRRVCSLGLGVRVLKVGAGVDLKANKSFSRTAKDFSCANYEQNLKKLQTAARSGDLHNSIQNKLNLIVHVIVHQFLKTILFYDGINYGVESSQKESKELEFHTLSQIFVK